MVLVLALCLDLGLVSVSVPCILRPASYVSCFLCLALALVLLLVLDRSFGLDLVS